MYFSGGEMLSGYACVGQGMCGKSLDLSLNFAVNLKLLQNSHNDFFKVHGSKTHFYQVLLLSSNLTSQNRCLTDNLQMPQTEHITFHTLCISLLSELQYLSSSESQKSRIHLYASLSPVYEIHPQILSILSAKSTSNLSTFLYFHNYFPKGNHGLSCTLQIIVTHQSVYIYSIFFKYSMPFLELYAWSPTTASIRKPFLPCLKRPVPFTSYFILCYHLSRPYVDISSSHM